MPLSNKNLIAPRPITLMAQMCRVQRRKLTRRHNRTIELRNVPPPNSQTEQVAGSLSLDEATAVSEVTFGKRKDGRETFLKKIVEACTANVAVLDESGNILYVSGHISADANGVVHPDEIKQLHTGWAVVACPGRKRPRPVEGCQSRSNGPPGRCTSAGS